MTLLLVIGFYFVQHRSVPNVALPPGARTNGSQIVIPFAMQKPNGTQETWVLSRNASQQYFVSVFVNERMVRRFQANRVNSQDSSGVNYTSLGDLKFDGQSYQVTGIHINPNQSSGYITFKPMPSNTSNERTNTANSTAG